MRSGERVDGTGEAVEPLMTTMESEKMIKQNIAPTFKRAALSLFVVLLSGFLPFELAQALDLTVTNVEVTQAIQTPTNTIQLVAQRSTAVRATIGVTDSPGPVPGVTGQL